MKALISVVADLEGAISGGDHAKRVSMLRQVTGLFVQQAPRLSQEQIDAFDTVIVRLSHDIETAARTELSASLADVPNAPHRIVRDLAFDPSAEVAGPVLERSERLDDDDLVQVASRGDRRTCGPSPADASWPRPSPTSSSRAATTRSCGMSRATAEPASPTAGSRR